jgi:hypothetical protein
MTISRSRALTGALTTLLLTAALLALTIGGVSAAHAARARSRSCDISKVADRLGPTSVTSLKVLNVSCRTGVAVVRAFHACRLKNGPSGRCVRLVMGGYACMEQRTNAPTQITGTVTCRKSRASVIHRYTQVL